MQKILMILICMFIGSAHATEMCAKNNTVVVPLDATVEGQTGYGSNWVESINWSPFAYGKIYGATTCLSLQEIQEIQGEPDLTNIPQLFVLNTDDDVLIGRSGNDENGNGRTYCLLKMTHPMSSNWVVSPVGSGYGCGTTNYCIGEATYRLYSVVNFRIALFNSIGASMAEKQESETEAETE